MKSLKDRVAVVSGGGRGIGQAVCEVLAEHGAWVLVTDIDIETAQDSAEKIRAAGGAAEAARVDIACRTEVEAAVQSVANRFGRVDVLVNNAAYIGKWHDVLQSSDEEWEGCLRTTLLGTQHFTRAVLPWMIPQRSGSIMIVSSIQGMVACPNSISYTTAKAGLIGYARSAACDYGKHNIRVNVISPGAINVGYSPEPGDPAHTYQINNTFLGRVGLPREVAHAAAFLASDASSYITGATLPVDGGWTAM
ncbi:MAG TPA: SDR family NAD(P)-dependent oxidoreductase [Tepidisphaeraceae bacterium]|nr:SDR family NAD(P)-dependent oxidoreductase [Tepidisphaeraceae bacterium]